jgi:hypothetical protein
MTLAPRAVVVHRCTEYDELLAHHGTRGQAEFFLRSRGRDISEVDDRHAAIQQALRSVASAIPADWRRGTVERADLAHFLFAPDDLVVVVGQDGLVANTAKYLNGQPVIGLNPEPTINPGVLVRHPVAACAELLSATVAARVQIEHRTMVQANTDDGQQLIALNEIYLGHPSHQSARYQLQAPDGDPERQSSSGILIGTGTGATGWCRSAWQERHSPLALPAPADPALCWFVREAWPSPATGTSHTEGLLQTEQALQITSETDGLVLFGDGIEADRIALAWGQRTTITTATPRLALVTAG